MHYKIGRKLNEKYPIYNGVGRIIAECLNQEDAEEIIKALEKQNPKTSIDADSYYACPVCDEEVDHLDTYCKYCGQRLYWGEFWDD